MKSFIRINLNLNLVTASIGELDILTAYSEYNTFKDYFVIDQNNLTIKKLYTKPSEDYFYLFTPNLFGDEEEVILQDNFFLRPTKQEPIIRGLYATVYRHGRTGAGKYALNLLGDVYLNSRGPRDLKKLAKECVFSTKKRLLEGRKVCDPEKVIPQGCYCYTYDEKGKQITCPYWSLTKSYPKQENGYCSYLKKGDWEGYCTHLWDQVKECEINRDDE